MKMTATATLQHDFVATGSVCRRCRSLPIVAIAMIFLATRCSAFVTIPAQKGLTFTSSRVETSLAANLATQLLIDQLNSSGDDDDEDKKEDTTEEQLLQQQAELSDQNNNRKKKEKLSRPERKALERERKAQRAKNHNHRRKHNYAERDPIINGRRGPGEGRYDLHSTDGVTTLCKDTTTPEEVIRAIKRAQNLHDSHDIRAIERFLLEEAGDGFAYGFRGSLLARLAVAALHMNNHELARRALEERRLKHRPSMMPMESSAIIRGLLRVHNVTDALEVLDDELSFPLPGTSLDSAENKERVKHRALALGSIASRHFFEGEPNLAVQACTLLGQMGPLVQEARLTAEDLAMPWTRIVQGAAQCESKRRDGNLNLDHDDGDEDHSITNAKLPCNLIYSVLDAMTRFPSVNDDRTYEAVSNGLVRRTVFVTGAVNMDGLPKADRGEAAFIGRSNVGKSSLVNMLTNRKSLAYTSKTPGKTQQFNYFAVNDKPGRESEIRFGDEVDGEMDADSFYIVDLPGFGFAKVPDHIRRDWALFMSQYMTERNSLKVLFHLVDARHGPTDEDARIMRLVADTLPKHVSYVVVLTKADKNVRASKKKLGRVAPDVMDKLQETMKLQGVGRAPYVLTSAETKLGRDEVWRYLRLAAEY